MNLSGVVSDPRNFLLENAYGGFLLVCVLPGVYEVHTQFLPQGRGKRAFSACVEAMEYMFTRTDCLRLITKAREDNEAAKALAHMFMTERGKTGVYHYFDTDYWHWAEQSAMCKAEGERFHDMVGDETNHGEDDTHDHHVGGALMVAKHNIQKAQYVYNHWAVMAGYETMLIESQCPPVVSVGDMRLTVEDEVKLCQ